MSQRRLPVFLDPMSLGEDDAPGQGQSGRRAREGGRTLGEVPGHSGFGTGHTKQTQLLQTGESLPGMTSWYLSFLICGWEMRV